MAISSTVQMGVSNEKDIHTSAPLCEAKGLRERFRICGEFWFEPSVAVDRPLSVPFVSLNQSTVERMIKVKGLPLDVEAVNAPGGDMSGQEQQQSRTGTETKWTRPLECDVTRFTAVT